MKKFLVTITSLILICIISIGCGQTDANIETSKALNKNLNLLTNTINRLDTVDNEYLVNNDLYSVESISNVNQMPTPKQSGKSIKLASSSSVIIEDNNIQSQLKEALTNEIINRLFCDSNGNCKLCNEKYIINENGNCSKCNQTIICDENGNCTSCGEVLQLDDSNCNNCGINCVTNTSNNTCGKAVLENLQTISNNNKEIELEYLNVKNDIVYDNNYNINDNNYGDIDNNINKTTEASIENNTHKNEEFDNVNDVSNYNNDLINQSEEVFENTLEDEKSDDIDNANTNNDNDANEDIDDTIDNNDDYKEEPPVIKYYYYSEESFNPNILRYKPRFISNVNYPNANNNIERYIEKLQKLYTMTADVVEANNTLANYKVVILNDIDEARKLNNCILSGECTPTSNQRQALDNYILDIRNTINHLRNCNGDLTNEINKISNGNTGITHSIDVTNSNYLRILNHIDTRISYHENAIATLEQIKYILEDAQNNSDSTVDIEDLNSNIKEDILNDYIDNPENNNDSSIVIDDEDNTIIIVETPSSSDNEQENGDIFYDTNEDNNTLNSEELQDDTNIDTEYTLSDNLDNDYNNTDEIVNPEDDLTLDNNENIDNDTVYPIEDNDLLEDTQDDIDSDTTHNTFSNIDTYNEPTYNNLDLLGNDTTVQQTVDENSNTNEFFQNDSLDNDNTLAENNEEDIHNTNSSAQFVNDSDNINNNEFVSNGENSYGMNGNEYGFGSNGNNLHENTIISQNNINGNDLDNNAYHYDENGHLYNNTNGYDTNNINNINNKNNNVNTYKYNTLIDSINRGTVNNGINNLSIAQ